MSKYRNQPTVIDGIRFDSKAEAARYLELKALQTAGEIVGLEVHPRYPLTVNGVKVCTYEADFRYSDTADGSEVVEDVKGVKTSVYRLKAKLMLAVHGIAIREVAA